MLSILIPTRSRTESLKRLLNSIISNANDINNVEIVIGYDHDDPETARFLKDYMGSHSYVPFIVNKKVTSMNVDLINPMAKLSSGKYLWVLNDDTEIKSRDFDILIESYIEDFLKNKPNRLLLATAINASRLVKYDGGISEGVVIDYHTKMTLVPYPIITRESFEILQFFFPPEIPDVGCEVQLAKIFHMSLANRFIIIPEVVIFDYIMNTASHKRTTSNYTAAHLNRDISKIDEVVLRDGIEYEINIRMPVVKISITVKCKLCGNYIWVNSSPTHNINNIIKCEKCDARNVMSDKCLSYLNNSAEDTEKQLTTQII